MFVQFVNQDGHNPSNCPELRDPLKEGFYSGGGGGGAGSHSHEDDDDERIQGAVYQSTTNRIHPGIIWVVPLYSI